MLVFDEGFKAESANYMIFELPQELHEELKEKKELCIKSPDLMNDAVIVSSNGTYLLKKHEISNTQCVAERVNEIPAIGDIYNVKSIKHYKLIAEKIFPPKKDLIDFIKKKTIKFLVNDNSQSWSFCFSETCQNFSISEFEIRDILEKFGCRFFPENLDRAYIYR